MSVEIWILVAISEPGCDIIGWVYQLAATNMMVCD